jgi:imidazole glycerol-phosphate synthase subunit HisH
MLQKKIVIIDYGLGNLFSVQHVCKHLGFETIVSQDQKDISNADALILPGVGAFGDAITQIRTLDLEMPIKDFVDSGKPFMGVCLGMQLLFSESDEFGSHKGLDIIKGSIKKIPGITSSGNKVRVPQIAWNRIWESKNGIPWKQSPLSTIKNGSYMYFVHSYYAAPAKTSVILTETEYEGLTYCSSVIQNNVFATQFHPEKSAEEGIEIYRNWLTLIK